MVLKMDVSYVEKDITEENLREIRSDGIIITDILTFVVRLRLRVILSVINM